MIAPSRPRLALCALFAAGVFFGGGLDHVIFATMNNPISHYGLHVGRTAQLAFSVFDFALMGMLIWLHRRWSKSTTAGPQG